MIPVSPYLMLACSMSGITVSADIILTRGDFSKPPCQCQIQVVGQILPSPTLVYGMGRVIQDYLS